MELRVVSYNRRMSALEAKPRNRRPGTVMLWVGVALLLFALASSDGGMNLNAPFFIGAIILIVGGFIQRNRAKS